MPPVKAPTFREPAFSCPHCEAYAKQNWADIFSNVRGGLASVDNIDISFCSHCGQFSLWLDQKMIYPDISGAPAPNVDLDPEIKADYLEASSIVARSPRGAAALLRLCIQKLCKQLGQPGININDDIKALVKDGLPVRIQKALDIVRVVGNEAVHPGELDLKDDIDTAYQLFNLINFIAHDRISQPKAIDALYATLPDEKRKGIEGRDKAP